MTEKIRCPCGCEGFHDRETVSEHLQEKTGLYVGKD